MANSSPRHWNLTSLMATSDPTHVKKTWVNYCSGEESRDISFASCREGLQCLWSLLRCARSTFQPFERGGTLLLYHLYNKKSNTLWAKKPGWMMERGKEEQYLQVTAEVIRGGAYLLLYPCANWVPFAPRQSRSTNFLRGSLSHKSSFENRYGTITSCWYSFLLRV